MLKGIRKIGEKIELMQKPFRISAMISQVENTKLRWQKKMIIKTAQETWDGEGLSEPI
jgi:hypothetical protein